MKSIINKIKTKNKAQIITLIILSILAIVLISLLITQIFIKKEFRVKNLKDHEIEVGTTYKKPNLEVCYGTVISCHKATYQSTGKINTKKLGTYNITYKLKYKNKEKTINSQIKVIDRTKPKIKIYNQKLIICPNGTPQNTIVKASDNYDGDISNKIKTKVTKNSVTFTVKDSSGNQTSITKKAKIEDKVTPVIKLKGSKTEYIKLNQKYQDKGAEATDTCDGNITKNLKITNNVNTSKVGVYKVTYEVTDKSGNKSKETRIVKVTKQTKSKKETKKTIYLTFDDGPSEYTKKLLDVLKKYDVKATFFVTNKVKQFPKTVKRAYGEGHTIGLHTWSHKYSIYKSEKTYLNDLYKIENEVVKLTGAKPSIIRFPGGSSNTISKSYKKGIMKKLTKEVEKQGYIYVDWNVYSGDAGETSNTSKIASNVIKSLNNRKTNIVLQHDIHSYSVNAVEKIIKYGKKHGYNFAPITETTPVLHHNVNN